MKENLNSNFAENNDSLKPVEAPLTPEELATLEKQYSVVTPVTEQGPDKSDGSVTELQPDPGDGQRRVMIDGQSYKLISTDSGKLVEMVPYSLDDSGNTEYGEPVRSETLFAKVDPEIAKIYEAKLNNFTGENFNSLDRDGREQLINNFFSGTEKEIQDRILQLSSDDSYSAFGRSVFAKVGYGENQFQIGYGWNKKEE